MPLDLARVAKAVSEGLSSVCSKDCNLLMPYGDSEKKKAHNKAYRENNKKRISEGKRAWQEANKERLKEQKRVWYAERMKDPEFRQKNRERADAWAKENPERHAKLAREGRLRREYGISSDDYARLLQEQRRCCAICGSDKSGRSGCVPLFVDHDHRTGKIRGLLCNDCNLGLSKFKEEPAFLRGAAAYLERS